MVRDAKGILFTFKGVNISASPAAVCANAITQLQAVLGREMLVSSSWVRP